MNEVKKERDSLEFVLEKERKKFEEMTLSMKIRLSEVSSYMHSCIMGTFYFQRHHSGHPERIALLVMLLLGKYLDTSLEAGMYHRYFPGRHMTTCAKVTKSDHQLMIYLPTRKKRCKSTLPGN